MASAMYCLSPIVDSSVEISLPTCMYRMNPVNQNIIVRTPPSRGPKQEAGGSPIAAVQVQQLERRQQALLTRLMELRSQVEARQQQLLDGGVTMAATAQLTAGSPLHQPGELVVLASAAWPPLSLLTLPALLPGLSLTSHLHSSAAEAEVSGQLRRLFTWRASQQPQTHIRLIWKPASELAEPLLLVAPASQACPLSGEEQLCRYLARTLLPHHYEAAGLERAATVDQLLEHSSQLRHGAAKQRQAAVKALQAALSTAPFLLGQQQSLVDGVVWSALRSSHLHTPPTLTAWLARINSAARSGEDYMVAENFGSREAVKTATNSTGEPTDKERRTSPAASRAVKAAAVTAGHRSQLGLLHYLTRRDVSYQTIHHPAVMTVDAMMPYLHHVSGGLTKNLLLRDKKKALYMLTAAHDAQFQLSDAAAQVAGAKDFRFADQCLLEELLGITAGSVSPLALINDRGGRVQLLLDRRLVDGSYDRVWLHPLTNTATTGIRPADLLRFLNAIAHQPILLSLE